MFSMAVASGAVARPRGKPQPAWGGCGEGGFSAEGAKCNSQGQAKRRFWDHATQNILIAEGAKYIPTFRAFSAPITFLALLPGQLAQGGVPNRPARLGCKTLTFRAFDALS
jgi:hypothetical protein